MGSTSGLVAIDSRSCPSIALEDYGWRKSQRVAPGDLGLDLRGGVCSGSNTGRLALLTPVMQALMSALSKGAPMVHDAGVGGEQE